MDNLGGAITMINMVSESYDCFWIIKPPKTFFHRHTHLYLKIVEFSDFGKLYLKHLKMITNVTYFEEGNDTQLVIHNGLTSTSELVEILKPDDPNFQLDKEYIVLIKQGFYLRFSGTFNKGSRLIIAYSAFGLNGKFFFPIL